MGLIQLDGDRFYGKLWWFAFCGTALVALSIQLVILPYLLPHLHAGHGLMIGGDWIEFHDTAVRMAETIRSEGWAAWRLRPDGANAPPGIAAVFYVLAVAEPFTLVPLNAALHAAAGVLLAKIVENVTEDRWAALLGALPLLLMPTAATWYSQIHKDGVYIAGILFFLYGWVRLVGASAWRSAKSLAAAAAYGILGTVLAWLVRPYIVQVLLAFSLVLMACVMVTALVRWRRGCVSGRRLIIGIGCALSIVAGMPMMKIDTVSSYARIYPENSSEMRSSDAALPVDAPEQIWKPTAGLPSAVDAALRGMSNVRRATLLGYPDAATMLDKEFLPQRAVEFIHYFPRAVQIGLFAPFPVHWVSEAKSRGSNLMRRVTGGEMLLVYGAIMLLPFAVVALHRKLVFWVSLGFSSAMLLLYVYIAPNLGTLHRHRYVFLMTIIALCIGGARLILKQRSSQVAFTDP
jgi:hypothetical protein